MEWDDDGSAVSEFGTCPACGDDNFHLKARFLGGPPRSLDRRIQLVYARCCSDCPGGLNHRFVTGSHDEPPRTEARRLLQATGTRLGREMAGRI